MQHADRDRLFTRIKMKETAELAFAVGLCRALLESSREQHVAYHAA